MLFSTRYVPCFGQRGPRVATHGASRQLGSAIATRSWTATVLPVLAALTLLAGDPTTTKGAPPVVGDRLPPPQQVETLPLGRSAGPTERTKPKTESLSSHLWTLPIPEVIRTPVRTSAESIRVGWLHPARDVPVIASDERPQTPQTPRLNEVPRSYVASRSPFVAPSLAAFPRESDKPPTASVNPVEAVGFQSLVHAVPAPATKPAPPLALSIPDPDAALRAVQLPLAAIGGVEPAVSRESPPRPMLK